jgi:NAD(P)-dependent dehydrogenase (short-subunit alcohol dehydrogenase family)
MTTTPPGQPASGTRQEAGLAGEAGRSDAAIWRGRFNDQVVLVTGAAGGLATPACRRIAAEGGTVACTGVHLSGDGSSPDSCLRLDVKARSAYAASKAALNTLVKVVAKECAAEFVTVNAIAQL